MLMPSLHTASRIFSLSVSLGRRFFVAFAVCLFPLVIALPTSVPTSELKASVTKSNASSTPSDTKEDRNEPLQVLADGTQDLAALVGIFATDSVERYAIDYNKGYLSASSATLSMLGLLGYVRALIKLGLGAEKCHNAGFDTRALRPLFGVPDFDRLPSDVLHDVHYVERMRLKNHVRWKLADTRKHTVDTMAALDWAVPYYRPEPNALVICSVALNVYSQKLRRSAHYIIPLLLAIFIGVTCFIISPFRGGFTHRTWTMFYATFGLSFSLLISAVAWAWVYAQEQLPAGCEDWILSRASTMSYRASEDKQDHFAFIGSGYSYVTFDLKVVRGRLRVSIRAMSLICAFSAIVGYVCQYVEVRRTSPSQAAKWLALQGLFAILRVGVWIWNPGFDDFWMDRLQPSASSNYLHFSEAQMVMLWYTHIYPTQTATGSGELPIGLRLDKDPPGSEQLRRRDLRPEHWSAWTVPDDLRIPAWVLPGLDNARRNVYEIFQLAQRLRNKASSTLHEDVETFTKAEFWWDMPGWLFMLWVDAHTKGNILADSSSMRAYGCRVIRDKQGMHHFLPYWTSQLIYSVRKPIQIFGNPEEDSRMIFAFEDFDADPADADEARKQWFCYGWDGNLNLSRYLTSRDKNNLSYAGIRRQEIVDRVNTMWKDLDHLLLRARGWKE